MAKDRVRLSKVSFSFFILRKCSYSNWQIPTRLSPGCWGTMLKRRALSFLRADSYLSRRCSNIKGAISVLNNFYQNIFQISRRGLYIGRCPGCCGWMSQTKVLAQNKRRGESKILFWNEICRQNIFFAQGALLIRANQGHSISTVEVIKKLLLYQSRKFFWFQCRCCDGGRDGWRHNSFGDKKTDNSGWTGGGCGSISNTCCNSRNLPQVKRWTFQSFVR